MSAWDDLRIELDSWADGDDVATFWWRDDDAIDHTPALHHLYSQSREYDVPLTLAVIPDAARMELCTGSDTPEHLRIVQHGYAHVNHAPHHEKKSEFGNKRATEEVVTDIVTGLSRISGFPFFTPAFVPPWNRIAEQFYGNLRDAGIQGVSTFGARSNRLPIDGLVQVNTHVDIIDWKGSRGFAGIDAVSKKIRNHLVARRQKDCDSDEPTGILTHHLVHDEACWKFLDALFSMLKKHKAVRWLNGTEVFAL